MSVPLPVLEPQPADLPLEESARECSALCTQLAASLLAKGYAVVPNALPPLLAEGLWLQLQHMSPAQFHRAGVGRERDHALNQFVRTDEICWINGESAAGAAWLDWCQHVQRELNRQLFLGLFSFESHFAHYAPGDFYRRHLDAFKGEANRVLSLVAYLNPGWQPDAGGELVLYTGAGEGENLKVTPAFGTLVLFLSEDFPHEVLPAQRDRYSVAGWFRVNSSSLERADPPR